MISLGAKVSGDHVEEFEERFAAFIGVRHCVAVSSGTAGLMVALMSLLSEPGQRVLTSPLTFAATANSALVAGGVPVFGDVDGTTLNLDVGFSIEEKIGAITPVHLYGLPADIDGIRRRSGSKYPIIEDAAQALGAERDGKKVGSLGDVGVFSFYNSKHISLGEGGMITTNDEAIAERCKMIRSHGQKYRYYHTLLGYNFRLPPLLAKLGVNQLPEITKDLARREQIASIYESELRDVEGISFQRKTTGIRHAYYKFPVVLGESVGKKIRFIARKLSRDLGHRIGIGYRLLVYQQPFYRNITRTFWAAKFIEFPDYSSMCCPIAESVVGRILELPTDHEVDVDVAKTLAQKLVETLKEVE